MSVSEILTELEHLTPGELSIVQEKIDLLRPVEYFDESPEEIAAIDEGRRSAREEGTIPIEQVIAEIPRWTLKS